MAIPRNNFSLKTNGIIGLVVMVLVFIGVFILAKAVFKLLMWLTPLLLIAALIIDHQSVIGFGKWLIGLVKRNPVVGIVAVLLSLVLYPITSVFLFFKALTMKKVRGVKEEMVRRRDGEYVDHEVVDSRPTHLDLDGPRPTRQRIDRGDRTEDADYEELFD